MANLQNLQRATGTFLDTVCRRLEEAFRETGAHSAEVSWTSGASTRPDGDLHWWAGNFGGETEKCLYLGAVESEHLDFGTLTPCFEAALNQKFGAGELHGEAVAPDEIPAKDVVRFTFEVTSIAEDGGESVHALECVLTSRLDAKLAKPAGLRISPPANPQAVAATAAANSLDLLMRVEVPVSVTFGSTRVRMRELLNLTSGSVVELDQTLGEHVEVRVNNCVIARGEVVAVDGNYGVRIMELASGSTALPANGSTK